MQYTVSPIQGFSEASLDEAVVFLTVYHEEKTGRLPSYSEEEVGIERHPDANLSRKSATRNLFDSLKYADDFAYLYLTDPHAFSETCADLVNSAKASRQMIGRPFESDHVFVAGDFPIELSPDDQKIMALITEKKDAFERLRAALPEAIKGALELEPDAVEKALRFEGNALEIAINGLLARNMIYKSEHTNADEKKYDEKMRLKEEAMDLFRLDDPQYPNTPNVAKMLAEFTDAESASPDRIFNKIMSNIVCTKEYLQELQNKPAYLNQPSRAVG